MCIRDRVYCIYKLKKAEGDLPVNILIVADEPRLADVVYTGTDGLDYAQKMCIRDRP